MPTVTQEFPRESWRRYFAEPSRTLGERVLLERYSRQRDQYTRGVLVERFLPLARSLARRYESAGVSASERSIDRRSSERWDVPESMDP
ncbi:MAG: hypothetical protein QOE95_2206, partial [Gaiellaceae bacterium]|nr:hypothetical protein [Gaiellaceae bacterium]